MGVLRYTFRSFVTRMDADITILMPSNWNWRSLNKYVPGMRFQTLYLMHGGGEGDNAWLRRTRIEEYAEKNQIMVVCPGTHNGMFMNTAYGVEYERYITEELPTIVQSFFPGALSREDTFIAGQGLGAGGALALALKHPDLYSVCVSLTPGAGVELDDDLLRERIKTNPSQRFLYGEDEKSFYKKDVYRIAKENKEKGVPLPKLYINCDDQDTLGIPETVTRQATILKDLGYDVHFDVTLGPGHDRNYCDRQIRRAIQDWLPLRRKPIYPDEEK